MISLDIDNIFYEGWEDSATILTTAAMARAILSAFSENIVYYQDGVVTQPAEGQLEAIEAGIADVTTSIV